MASYAVFFALTWQLWAAQAAYDVKFYTHDWCHRIFFLFHLLLYGCLAAFTSDFDSKWVYSPECRIDQMTLLLLVFWHSGNSDVSEVTLAQKALNKQSSVTKLRSFKGITLVLAVSRMFLLLQYTRGKCYGGYTDFVSYWVARFSCTLSSAASNDVMDVLHQTLITSPFGCYLYTLLCAVIWSWNPNETYQYRAVCFMGVGASDWSYGPRVYSRRCKGEFARLWQHLFSIKHFDSYSDGWR